MLPAALCEPEQQAALRHVLHHELAHLAQRDARGRARFALALPLFYFHPLYWWLRGRAELAAELVADDLAARRSDRRAYARALIGVSERGGSEWPAPFGAASMLRSQSEFYRRMKMLLQRDSRLSTRRSRVSRAVQRVAAVALVGVSAAAIGVPQLPAQDPAGGSSTRELVRERDRLRAEIATLRAEVRSLRRALATRPESIEEVPAPELALTESAPAESPLAEDPAEEAPTVETFEAVDVPTEAVEEVADAATEDFLTASGRTETAVPDRAPSLFLAEPKTPFADRDGDGLPDTRVASVAEVSAQTAPATVGNQFVVELVTTAIDLRGELEIAQCEFSLLKKTVEVAAAPSESLTIAEIKLETTRRKYAAVRAMIDAEIDACRLELDSLQNRVHKGVVPHHDAQSRMVRLKARIDMLGTAR